MDTFSGLSLLIHGWLIKEMEDFKSMDFSLILCFPLWCSRCFKPTPCFPNGLLRENDNIFFFVLVLCRWVLRVSESFISPLSPVSGCRGISHTHTVRRTVSLTSWSVSPPGCEWRGEGSLNLMDGIYNCSSNFMAVCYVCTLLRVHLCLCVFVFLPSPLTSGVALVQTVCVFGWYMQSCSEFSHWIPTCVACVRVCVCLHRVLQML